MKKKKQSIKSDLKRLDSISDAEIDYSNSPALDDSFFERVKVELPIKKDSVTLRIDHEVLAFFKSQGKGYQTKINAVLKAYAQTHIKKSIQR